MGKETPMQKQYNEIKSRYRDEILFFRMGDFYEMFNDDAVEATKILNITLTARGKGSDNEMPMCGVPFHAAEGYISKLTRAGRKVAVCDQVSDPSLPGIVKREVVRVVTPGTTLDESVLDNKVNNFLISLVFEKDQWGLAVCDVTTGEFQATEFASDEVLKNELNRIGPKEVIVSADLYNDIRYQSLLSTLPNVNIFTLPPFEKPDRLLTEHFKVASLASFGLEKLSLAVQAAGSMLGYLKETQKSSLEHILNLSRYALESYMTLDQATIRNLELMNNAWTFQAEGSLIGVIDKTITSMGGRLLRRWLLMPLLSVKEIVARHEAVDAIKNDSLLSSELLENLKQMSDLERLLGRIGCNRTNARDVVNLKNSLKLIPLIKQTLMGNDSALLQTIEKSIPDHAEVIELIEKYLVEEPPVATNEGGMIKDGFDSELDELREISRNGKNWLRDLQVRESERTGISTLKVKYNKVFGYYIEVSRANTGLVPEDYVRKQTLVNAERYITPELKEYEEKIIGAEDKLREIEVRLFYELRDLLITYFASIQKTAQLIAQLDVLWGFALLAKERNYCLPVMNDDGGIMIKAGRHPVIETIAENYVPNDVGLDHQTQEFVLLTGPNMSGKSSFIRQVALISLMAQIGSFVPAQSAELGVVDRIFTRVGASDNVAQGVSTFMNEMQEAANILHNATDKSLIILDELGRGTSTYDGVSIAWAMMAYIHDQIKAKTIFATHYHELVEVADGLDRGTNYCVAVSENNGSVIFLHQIIKGSSSQSYGIEVAKIAGLPKQLTNHADSLLTDLENKIPSQTQTQRSLPLAPKESLLEKSLKEISVNELTPIEALQLLEKWQNDLI